MTHLPVPSAKLSIADGGLGLSSNGAGGASFKVGTSSGGVAAQFVSFLGIDVQRAFTELGDGGPLPNATAKHLINSGGKKVTTYKVTPTTPGASSAITRTGGSTGPLVTLSSTPNDQYENQLEIVDGGARGTATFRYTTDGGDTWSAEFVTAATFDLETGVTVNFPTTTDYAAGETYSWTDTAPIMTSGDVATAVDEIIASAHQGRLVHILGQAATAADCRTIATMLATKFTAALNAKRYMFFLLEAPAVAKATLITEFASFAEKGVVVCAGFAEIVNDKTAKVEKRSIGRVVAPRIARNPLATQASRTLNDGDLDRLTDVDTLVPSGAVDADGYWDSASDSSLNDARFTTLMTHVGYEGVYICNAQTMAGTGSDFAHVTYLNIILEAAEIWNGYALKQVQRRLRKNPTTGYIAGGFADAIEHDGEELIRKTLGSNIVSVRVLINREDDLRVTPLKHKIRIVVDDYALELEDEIGLAASLPDAA